MYHQVRFSGDSGAHQKEFFHQGAQIGKVSSSHKENGETFRRVHIMPHTKGRKCESWRIGKSSHSQCVVASRCILPSIDNQINKRRRPPGCGTCNRQWGLEVPNLHFPHRKLWANKQVGNGMDECLNKVLLSHQFWVIEKQDCSSIVQVHQQTTRYRTPEQDSC